MINGLVFKRDGIAATGESNSNEGEDRGVEPQITETFWKSKGWLPVILLMFVLLWGGCRAVEPVYQNVPASSDAREADSYADTHSRVYYVGGEVRTPGPRIYMGETTVATAIQAAGDFTKAANKGRVKLIRFDGRSETMVVVDLRKAIHPPNDPPVYPGDKIEVPRKWWH
jgi:hypothetical protein